MEDVTIELIVILIGIIVGWGLRMIWEKNDKE